MFGNIESPEVEYQSLRVNSNSCMFKTRVLFIVLSMIRWLALDSAHESWLSRATEPYKISSILLQHYLQMYFTRKTFYLPAIDVPPSPIQRPWGICKDFKTFAHESPFKRNDTLKFSSALQYDYKPRNEQNLPQNGLKMNERLNAIEGPNHRWLL